MSERSMIYILFIMFLALLVFFICFFIYHECQKLNDAIGKRNKYKQVIFLIAALITIVASLIIFSQFQALYKAFTNLSLLTIIIRYFGLLRYFDYLALLLFLITINIGTGLFYWGLKELLFPLAKNYDFDSDKFLNKVLDIIILLFYEFINDTPYLQNKWIIFRNGLNWVIKIFLWYIVIILVTPVITAIFGVNIEFCIDIMQWYYHLPFITLLVLKEIESFLSGLTIESGSFGYEVEGVNIRKVSTYEELANDYEKVFPDHYIGQLSFDSSLQKKVLTAERRDSIAINNEIDNPALIEIIQEAKNKINKNSIKDANKHFQNFFEKLYLGENITINASIFSDVMQYYFDYLEYLIDSGNTILIIGKDAEQTEVIKDFIIKQSYEDMDIVDRRDVWNVRTTNEIYDGTPVDILVTTLQSIIDETAFNEYRKFFDNLKLVSFIDAQDIMSRDSFLPMLIGWKLNYRTVGNPLQYVFFMEHNEIAINDTLTHAYNLKNLSTINNVQNYYGENYIELWKTESPFRMQDEWLHNGSSNYYGDLVTLGAFGVTRGVGEVYITDSSEHSYSEALDNIIADGNYFEDYQSIIRNIKTGKLDKEIEGQSFVVTEDFLNNLPLMLRLVSRLVANQSTMIHIVSKPYLLRDYFYSKQHGLLDQSYEYQLLPSVDLSQQNLIYNFFCEAYIKKVTEEDLKGKIGRILFPDQNDLSVQEILIEALKRITNKKNIRINDVYDNFKFTKRNKFVGNDFIDTYEIQLVNDNLYRQIINNIKRVKLDILNFPESAIRF